MTTERLSPRRRRPHAAAGGRVLVGGLSVSLLLGLIGAMIRAEQPAQSAAASRATTAVASPDPTQPPVSPQGRAASPSVAPQVPAAPPVTRADTPPVTTSHGT
jgi:hypothetical protein